jgi:2-keto-myo-inositol isomerase
MLHKGSRLGRMFEEAALSAPYALNHVTTPYADFAEFAALAREQGMDAIEIRNDLDGVPIADGTPAAQLREEAQEAGVAILSINALQRFDLWETAREREAVSLAAYARDAGAAALVLCPVNDRGDRRSQAERARDLRRSLAALAPILADHGLTGLVEPLGFVECAVRRKQDAIDAIDETGTEAQFALLHDSFHHALSGEDALFPARTGLVHISGVEENIPLADMRDPHRVLVGPRDRLDNLGQIRVLRQGGYTGPLSFEAFSAQVHDDPDRAASLARSIAHLDETS